MKKRMSTRLGTAAAAGVMTLSMAVPAMAFEKSKETTVQVNGSSVRVSESTIDPDMTGSITLYKRLDNYGEYMQADGTPQAWVPGDPVRGVVLSYLKIADVETLADQGEVGVYYTNLSGAFVTYLRERGITQEDAGGASGSGTVLKADRTANGKNYYTTATMETLMNALNTDQTGVEDFLAKKGTAMAATDATGKTGADKLPLGLYLIAETDNTDAHVETDNLTGDDATTSGQSVGGKDVTQNRTGAKEDGYMDDIGESGVPDDKGTDRTIDPSNVTIASNVTPYLVSLPTTNVSRIGNYEAGTVWMYDVITYPKNSSTSITKKIVDPDDGETLRDQEDYEVGDTIHQVIYTTATPLRKWQTGEITGAYDSGKDGTVGDAKKHEVYTIHDTMSDGLTFDKVTKVTIRSSYFSPFRPAKPQLNSVLRSAKHVVRAPQLSDFPEDLWPMFATTYYASLDYSLNWNTVYAEQLYGEELVPDTDYIVTPDADEHGFSVDLTAAGRKKLDELDYKSTVTVWFDTTMNAKAEIGKANVNQPTLTWKNTNEAEQKVTGNLVKTYTYGLSLTKTGLTDPTKAGFEIYDQVEDTDGNGFISERFVDFLEKLKEKAENEPYVDAVLRKRVNRVQEISPTPDVTDLLQELKDKWPSSWAKTEEGLSRDDSAYDGLAKNARKMNLVKESDGVYHIYDEVTDKPADIVTTVHPDSKGKLFIRGLDSETYTVREIQTQDGYNLLKSTFDVTINAPDPDRDSTCTGSVSTQDGKTTDLVAKDGVVSINVDNYKTATLHTGGSGTTMLYVGGAALLAGAGLVVTAVRRKRTSDPRI